jgi:hypothetical protein
MNTQVKIHTREDFITDQAYDAYLIGVKMGTKINEYLDKGYIVFDNGIPITDKRFKFSYMGPAVGLVSKDGKSCVTYGNISRDNDGKVFISKSAVVNGLSKFKIIDPKDIKNIKF